MFTALRVLGTMPGVQEEVVPRPRAALDPSPVLSPMTKQTIEALC